VLRKEHAGPASHAPLPRQRWRSRCEEWKVGFSHQPPAICAAHGCCPHQRWREAGRWRERPRDRVGSRSAPRPFPTAPAGLPGSPHWRIFPQACHD